MHKAAALILPFILCFALFAGCKGEAAGNTLLPGSDGIVSVTVTSMPQGYDYFFTCANASELAQYILGMEITADFPEDPNVYAGMTWVITAEYEDGTAATVYLFGNMFIRAGNGPWLKVSTEAAEGFDALLVSLS